MSKPDLFSALAIALSEKQIPQVVENIENRSERIEALERVGLLRRQMLYPAELRAQRRPSIPLLLLEIPADFLKYVESAGSHPSYI